MSALVDEKSEFEKLGVKFLIIKEDMYDAVKDFYWEHFIPDEPVSRSLQISRGSFMDKFILTDILNHKCSIAAVNDNGDILAIRLAQIKSRGQWFDKMMDRAFMKIFRSEKLTAMLLGETWRRVGSTFIKLCKLINYDVWKAFDQLGCDKIYEDKAVCSARFHGIKGLGTEITKRSEALAAEMGCTHTYAMVTGIYSQKIFTKLNHETLVSVNYEDFKDENGELYLKDTREHTSIISCYKKLQ